MTVVTALSSAYCPYRNLVLFGNKENSSRINFLEPNDFFGQRFKSARSFYSHHLAVMTIQKLSLRFTVSCLTALRFALRLMSAKYKRWASPFHRRLIYKVNQCVSRAAFRAVPWQRARRGHGQIPPGIGATCVSANIRLTHLVLSAPV